MLDYTPEHGSNVDRKNIPFECKWHVEDIYATEAVWEEQCKIFKDKLPQLQALKGQIKSGAKLYAALSLQDELAKMLDKIFAYARLQQDADNTDQHLQSLTGQAEGLSAAFSSSNSFIEPEMLAQGEETIKEWFANTPELAEYEHYVQNLVRINSHVLSAEMEALFAESHLATCTAANAFRSLTSADMQFPTIKDGAGNTCFVSEGNYLLNMTSTDRELRKNSFQGLMNTYHSYRNTLATTLTGSARTAFFYAKSHHYKDTLESCLVEDNIPVSLYDTLIDTVHANLGILHDYMALKKELLGYNELHPYDIYVPLVENAGDSFACSFPEACQRVEEAVAPLGETYLQTLRKGFTEGWVDVYENKGKRSGAYSWGVYGVHPYVLLNYQERYNSISTIAHEMGHALHSYFSSSAQSFINSEYTIFCAEVASTTNENLLLEHTLKTATRNQKIFLLNQFLEQVRTTVYRQVQFAEFEKFIHNEITEGRSLQAGLLEDYWLESNRRYYGEALTVDKELASEWSRIPHFYTPFYVYKYATGYSAATAFASSILAGQEGAVEKYLGFLHAGGSDYSLNLLKNAGVDLTTPEPVQVTLTKFAEKLSELKCLMGKE